MVPGEGFRVMGVDPGLVSTGFGVVEVGPVGVGVVDAGVISTRAAEPLEARLNALYLALHRVMVERRPQLLVVEDLYAEYRFPRTALLMAHARGVVYLTARQLAVPVVSLSPAEVKRAVTGNGAAGKVQVQRSLRTLLGLREIPRPSHLADALGLAATGMARVAGQVPRGRPVRPAGAGSGNGAVTARSGTGR